MNPAVETVSLKERKSTFLFLCWVYLLLWLLQSWVCVDSLDKVCVNRLNDSQLLSKVALYKYMPCMVVKMSIIQQIKMK